MVYSFDGQIFCYRWQKDGELLELLEPYFIKGIIETFSIHLSFYLSVSQCSLIFLSFCLTIFFNLSIFLSHSVL